MEPAARVEYAVTIFAVLTAPVAQTNAVTMAPTAAEILAVHQQKIAVTVSAATLQKLVVTALFAVLSVRNAVIESVAI